MVAFARNEARGLRLALACCLAFESPVAGGVDLTQAQEARAFILPWPAERPVKCVDVAGDSAGAYLQLWDCNDFHGAGALTDQDFKFVLPDLNVDGPIMWAINTALCLNTPGDDQLQLWYCDTAPAEHTRWRITEDGRIRLASQPTKCVTNPLGIPKNGHKLKLQDCADGAPISDQINVLFALPTSTTTTVSTTTITVSSTTTSSSTSSTHTITTTSSNTTTSSTGTSSTSSTSTSPRPCLWNDWSTWSRCDETCHKYSDRHIKVKGQPFGTGCDFEATRYVKCTGDLCVSTEV